MKRSTLSPGCAQLQSPRPCAPAGPPPDPTGALDVIDARIQHAHELLSAIEMRLSRALKPEPATAYGSSRDNCPPTVREIADQAGTLVDRLGRLLTLIDL